ncbi:MAG: DotU family type IV/VI secretion system protein [Candidatus Electrothrix sp. GW3-4]|uniref:DotU family type IV/VI secretion system protein n=1 Tax=Candidatus Electrothrix sp. GW3-4 TaxID=3126740 RepID=UPI0030CCFE71
MSLLDCFVELIAYIAYFGKTASSTRQVSYEQLKTDLTHLVDKAQDSFQQSRLSQQDFDLARFAVFAWIDEVILSSTWSEKGRWQGEQLQRVYYQTTEAGELFFKRLNQLQPQQLEVREVYTLCLALGFSGRYCNPGDEFLLEQLKNSNLKLLGPESAIHLAEQERLFPEAYVQERGAGKNTAPGRGVSWVKWIVGAALSVVLYWGLFFIYRFVLDNVGENFISSVR